MGSLNVKFIRTRTFSAVILLLIVTVHLITTNAQVKRRRRTKTTPLWKQGPFTIRRLFEIVFNTYMDNTKQDPKKNFLYCSNFTSRFVLTKGSQVFNATLIFYNVTFHAFSRLDSIRNVTAIAVNNNTVISDAVITCLDMFVKVCLVRPFVYFNGNTAVHNIRSPYVRVTIKYTFAPVYKVELITAKFEQMNSVQHWMPIRCEYGHFKNELGYMMYEHFLRYEKAKVDAALFDRFQSAIQMSGIGRVLNLTVMP